MDLICSCFLVLIYCEECQLYLPNYTVTLSNPDLLPFLPIQTALLIVVFTPKYISKKGDYFFYIVSLPMICIFL